MTIRNLDHAVHPRSVAVFGASPRAGTVGGILIRNIVEGGFGGEVWPVNPKHGEIGGRRCYARAQDLPGAPDLAVIATPPHTVPGIVADLGARGCRAAVVVTAGLTRESGLRQARKHLGWYLDRHAPHLAGDRRKAILTSREPESVTAMLRDALGAAMTQASLRSAA